MMFAKCLNQMWRVRLQFFMNLFLTSRNTGGGGGRSSRTWLKEEGQAELSNITTIISFLKTPEWWVAPGRNKLTHLWTGEAFCQHFRSIINWTRQNLVWVWVSDFGCVVSHVMIRFGVEGISNSVKLVLFCCDAHLKPEETEAQGVSSVQLLSHVQLFATPWTAALQASLSSASSQSLLKLMSIELVMPSNHLNLCCPFSSHLQSFPALGSFLMSQFFASGELQSIGISASASVLPMNIWDWFPLGWTAWISLQSKGLSRVFSKHHSSKTSIL